MTQPDQFCWRALLGACALAAAAGAHAQSAPEPASSDSNVPPATAQKQAREIARGDPARWFREDASAAARLRTLLKEIGAGLQEAQGECRKLGASERRACMADARATYNQDMAGARARVMAEAR
jgi:hypothetical protein